MKQCIHTNKLIDIYVCLCRDCKVKKIFLLLLRCLIFSTKDINALNAHAQNIKISTLPCQGNRHEYLPSS